MRCRWDEWVSPARLLKLTDANIQRQTDLKTQHNPSTSGSTSHKKDAGKAAGGGGTATRRKADGGGASSGVVAGKKRGRDAAGAGAGGADDSKAALMKLDVPDVLKEWLVDDWERVTKRNQVRRRLCFATMGQNR